MINTEAMKSFVKTNSIPVFPSSGSIPVRTIIVPKIPNVSEAYINTRVAIFCIALVYQMMVSLTTSSAI